MTTITRVQARKVLFEVLPPATANHETAPTWEPLRHEMSDLIGYGLAPVVFTDAAESARRLNQWTEQHLWPFDEDYEYDLQRTDHLESDLWTELTALIKTLPTEWDLPKTVMAA